jgi:hypothetical protein
VTQTLTHPQLGAALLPRTRLLRDERRDLQQSLLYRERAVCEPDDKARVVRRAAESKDGRVVAHRVRDAKGARLVDLRKRGR